MPATVRELPISIGVAVVNDVQVAFCLKCASHWTKSGSSTGRSGTASVVVSRRTRASNAGQRPPTSFPRISNYAPSLTFCIGADLASRLQFKPARAVERRLSHLRETSSQSR